MSHSSSEDEAPEAVSFSSTKKSVQDSARAVRRFQEEEQRKIKEKRRAKDKVLKERKESAKARKAKGKAVEDSGSEEDGDEESAGPSRKDLEARMERAMNEANGESSDEDAGSDEGGSEQPSKEDDDGDVSMGSEEDGQEDEEMHASDHEEDESDNEVPPPPSKALQKDYLPDHLFTSAFSSIDSERSSTKPQKSDSNTKPRRKRVKKSEKDVVIGSRVVRTLPSLSSEQPSTAKSRTLAPPNNVNRFVNRRLNVRGSLRDAKIRGWERKAANLGVMKRNGPAARFVRDS